MKTSQPLPPFKMFPTAAENEAILLRAMNDLGLGVNGNLKDDTKKKFQQDLKKAARR